MTTVYLIRHGITDWMEAGLIQGKADRPLSEFGKEQADLTAKVFKDINISRIFTSPQQRAVQTANPICGLKGLDAEAVNGLQERDQGWWEGKKSPWRFSHGKVVLDILISLIYFAVVALTGESRAKFEDRVLKAWKEICSMDFKEPAVLVAHSGVLLAILKYVDGNDKKLSRKYFVDNCSITRVEIGSDGVARVKNLNDTTHLAGKVWRY